MTNSEQQEKAFSEYLKVWSKFERFPTESGFAIFYSDWCDEYGLRNDMKKDDDNE